MQPSSVVVLLLALAPLSATAGPETTRVLSCAHPNWPTRVQVAHYLRSPSVVVGETPRAAAQRAQARQQDQAFAIAQAEQVVRHVRHRGRLECWRGATHLLVTFHPPIPHAAATVTVRPGPIAAAP